MNLNWNHFESLMDAAIGDAPHNERNDNSKYKNHLQKVVVKRKALEKQQTLFCQATEETILQEYVKLRKAHRDFLSSFEEARSAYSMRK